MKKISNLNLELSPVFSMVVDHDFCVQNLPLFKFLYITFFFKINFSDKLKEVGNIINWQKSKALHFPGQYFKKICESQLVIADNL